MKPEEIKDKEYVCYNKKYDEIFVVSRAINFFPWIDFEGVKISMNCTQYYFNRDCKKFFNESIILGEL